MNKARLARRLAYGLAALLVAIAALLALADWLIDTPAVKAAIEKRLSSALGGQIAWEGLDLRVLPAPHGQLRRVSIEVPGAVSVRAEQVDAYLRLWPLLQGHPEIASLSVSRPEVRIAASGGAPGEGEPVEPLTAYRRVIEPVARALQKFAPDTEFRIDSAAIDLAAVGFDLRDLNVAARTTHEGLDLELEAASNLWKRLRVKGRVQYVDLSARAALEVDELAVLPDLPAARLRAQLSTDANSAIEGEADVALGALLESAKVKLRLPAAGVLQASADVSGIDLPRALAIARPRLDGLQPVVSLDGRLSAKVDLVLGDDWQVRVHVVKSDAMLKLAQLPWKISATAGQVSVSAKALEVRGLHGTLGESSYSDAAARLELGKPLRLAAASGKASLRLEQWFPWLRERVPQLEEITALAGGADVSLQRLALRFDRPADADFEALVSPRQVSAALKALPAAAAVSGGSVRVDPAQVRLDKVAVGMADAKALVSGTIAFKGPRIELAIAEGVVGEKTVQWALGRAGAPERLEPKTPLRVAAPRIAWGPGQALEAEALIDFDEGPQVGLALGWQPEQLDLRRLAIKDARSDAVLGARIAEKLVQVSFAGNLDGRSVAAMLRRPPRESGTARGEMRVTIDRERPQRTIAEGQLKLEALDLTWLAGRRALIQRADLSAQPAGLRIVDAEVDFEEQKFTVRGQMQRTAQGPVIDARVESPGVVIERLLPAEKKAEPPAAKPAPGSSRLWPLPVTGRVQLSAGFVQYQHYKIAPFEGSLDLERERAGFKVEQARMCGLSFPVTGEALPESLAFSTKITMRDQPIEETMKCLTGSAIEITGNADLSADLAARGKAADLIRNLTGTAQAELRKGRVKKFALIGNILSVRDIASLHGAKEEGFPYRSLSAKGRFEGGEFLLEEGFFDSDAARIAASGRIDLYGANTRLNVLLGLLTTVDRVAGAIPIIGDVFGGSMLALPVGVSGDIRDPLVVPLGPRAVTDRLLGIFERTLKLPGKLVVPPVEQTPPPR
jgi:hypothetical protein